MFNPSSSYFIKASTADGVLYYSMAEKRNEIQQDWVCIYVTAILSWGWGWVEVDIEAEVDVEMRLSRSLVEIELRLSWVGLRLIEIE